MGQFVGFFLVLGEVVMAMHGFTDSSLLLRFNFFSM